MQREEIISICDREILDIASRLFGVKKDALKLFAGSEGCANGTGYGQCQLHPYLDPGGIREDIEKPFRKYFL